MKSRAPRPSANGGTTVLSLAEAWNRPAKLATKRTMDVTISFVALVGLSPILLILAIAVKLSSPGPVFYRWPVVGRNGVPFIGYKFRSMCSNADQLKEQLQSRNEMNGPVFKLTNDPRVTKFGAWMRRYSLDELPQLYNVLKGDMSLVGPRPPLMTEYVHFTEHQRLKLLVKPGITCLWQINGRNEIKDFDQWVQLDLEYVRNWSPFLDVWILWKTAGEIFAGSGK